ncbi:hypothetical protein FDP41_000675 [Naegleria fowleri]|uniref:BTB domain-containing protein n=1 Tax=Naegleria fowleri TaxID=5763 RepID=A0A6A5CAK5_NAEFO|nr:uncharacterized protein FDP41_000675 [Naegleria fowleri]KAF0984776.1 hypothetical protein FDP41_000675 [Naegleria fowleri]
MIPSSSTTTPSSVTTVLSNQHPSHTTNNNNNNNNMNGTTTTNTTTSNGINNTGSSSSSSSSSTGGSSSSTAINIASCSSCSSTLNHGSSSSLVQNSNNTSSVMMTMVAQSPPSSSTTNSIPIINFTSPPSCSNHPFNNSSVLNTTTSTTTTINNNGSTVSNNNNNTINPSNNNLLTTTNTVTGLPSSGSILKPSSSLGLTTESTVITTTREEQSIYGHYTKIVDKSETQRTVTYANVSRLATDFGFLIDNEELSDCQLRVGSGKNQRTFHCHKVILCQRSEYFRNMFLVHRGMFLESSSTPISGTTNLPFSDKSAEVLTNSFGTRISIVEKPNIAPAVFEKVLQYIYTGRVTFTTKLKHRKIKDKTVHVAQMQSPDDIDNVISMCMHVLAAADELILLELKNFCVDYVKQYIDSESAIVLLDLALKYGSEDLIESCFDFIKHNAREVIASESLPFVSHLTMKVFLESEYLAVDEIELFRALLRWGMSQIEISDDTGLLDTEEDISDDEEVEDVLIDEETKEQTVTHIVDMKDLKDLLCEPPEEEELIFRKKQLAMNRKRLLMNDYINNDTDESESDTPFAVVKNPLRDDISLHTKFSLDPVPQNRHHTDLIQLANRLSDEDKDLIRQVVRDLIPCIRFPLMTAHQLTDVVEIFGIVDDSLLLEAYRHVCAPDRTLPSTCKRAQKRKGASENEQSHFSASTILKGKNRQEVIKMCGESSITKGKMWTLAFKASKDGFDSSVFHQKCDTRGPSVLVCRTTEGYIFGGYNSVEWNSNNQWLKANDTFLFSLVNPYNDGPRKLKVKNPQRAVYCHASSGPSFGGGTNLVFDPYDLYLDSSLKRGHTNVGGAYSTFRGGFRSDEAQKSLAGSLNAWILNEVEVFLLQ